MRSVFFGTPAAAVPTLTALSEFSDVVGVVTRPDAAKGRSKDLVMSPIAQEAERAGIPVLKPHNRSEILEMLAGVGPIDVGVVVAFGMILSSDVLEFPRAGMVNVHFSLLPRWRGAAPVERAILAGDQQTGVSIMAMDVGLDTGPVIATHETDIGAHESAGDLTDRLAESGAQLLAEVLPDWLSGRRPTVPQDHTQATYAPKLTTAESRLDLSEPAADLLRQIHAFCPRPGAHVYLNDERFKILAAAAGPGPTLSPGELAIDDGKLRVGTGTYPLELRSVQPAGKSVMDGAAWGRGRTRGLGHLT